MNELLTLNYTFKTTAIFTGKYYQHFGITSLSASLYGDKKEDIIEVTLKVSKNQSKPDKTEKISKKADYWGWFGYKDNKFLFIFHKRFLLNMCFTYGLEAAEKVNKGKAYRLEIVE